MFANPANLIKLIFCIVLFTDLSVFSQQIIIASDDESFSPAFESRYRKRGGLSLSEECQDLIKKKRVKKMNVYDRSGMVFSFFEFDNQGNISAEAYHGRFYFTIKRKHHSGQEQVTTVAHYLGPLLMRADTTSVVQHQYKNADTSMMYTEYKSKVYKRGILINDQNFFYNTNYFNGSQYLRTDYDTTVLYFCAGIDTAGSFEGSLRQGFINLYTTTLKEHAFYKKFKKTATSDYYVEGESFIEPDKTLVSFCGTTIRDFNQEEESLNENGLVDSRYYFSGGERVLRLYARYEYYNEQD